MQSDAGNTQWQYDVGIGNEQVGDILKAQGDFAGALKSYQAKQQIVGRLVNTDPANANWQRDLWVSYIKVGDALVANNDLAGALKAYEETASRSLKG